MDQKRRFKQDGFVVLPDFKSHKDISVLKTRANKIAGEHDFARHRDVFSTGQQRSRQAEEYFLGSANKMRCFFEEKAFGDSGQLTQNLPQELFHVLPQPLIQSINKIGHAMHDLDPVFSRFSHGEKLAELAADVGLQKPQIWQSMYIFKQPRIGGEVGWHQDTGFFFTTPQSVTTFWFAIDDATLDNGCMWVQRGGHKTPLRQRFIRDGHMTKILNLNQRPWPSTKEAVPLEVKAGTLVCFNGLLPHYSAANISDKPRHAYTLHVTDGLCDYAPENWIQRSKEFPVRGFV